jgi:hypothetical protein
MKQDPAEHQKTLSTIVGAACSPNLHVENPDGEQQSDRIAGNESLERTIDRN